MIEAKDVKKSASRFLIGDVSDVVISLDKSKGCYIRDAITDRDYLDLAGYYASNALGHNHPALSDKGFEENLLLVAKSKPANSDYYTTQLAEFVDTFSRLAKPDAFKHLFFVEGGALAVENAMKAAFDWKVRKNRQKGLKHDLGKVILHFREAFHGRTGYTLSVTNTDPNKTKFFPQFCWARVSNPKIRFPYDPASVAQVVEDEHKTLREIEDAFRNWGDDIAAILIEPIQGEGGDNHFRPEFFQQLRDIADSHEVLLIFDEVQTGLGITGKMWAHEHYGVVPDLVCFGKKTQVCGVMSTGRIDEIEDNVFTTSSRINSTWGGALVDMVRCSKILEVMHEEKLVEQAERVGKHMLRCLEGLQKKFPNKVFNVRGKGLMCAFDMTSGEDADRFKARCFEHQVMMLTCGRRTIRFRPPLVITEKEVDIALDVAAKVLQEQ